MSELKWVVEVKWILDAFPDAELHDDGVHIGDSVLPYNIMSSTKNHTWYAGEWAETIDQG